MRILYIEDEKYLADAVIHLLKKANIAVDWSADGEEGLDWALRNSYDCIVLDIMLPNYSGIDILRDIRARGNNTPVIMLTALSAVEDKVQALDYGADDYLAKPFKTAELIARLKALTRRPPICTTKKLTFADLSYNINNRTLNGQTLTAKEAELLEILLKNPTHVHSKAQLLARIWGETTAASDNYIEAYISYLRKKLDKINSSVKIKTVRGLGYKLTCD